jgi:hypothetical protein
VADRPRVVDEGIEFEVVWTGAMERAGEAATLNSYQGASCLTDAIGRKRKPRSNQKRKLRQWHKMATSDGRRKRRAA